MIRICVLLAACILSPLSHALVVLQYHHVDDHTPAITSTRPDVFKEHIQLLQDPKLKVVSLIDALNNLDNEDPNTNSVAITFDDAYLSIYDNAWPILKEAGMTFTVFVNPKQIDAKIKNMMTWEQLLELQEQGVTIANHSQKHPYLIEYIGNLDGYLDAEINSAEKRLREKLGTSHKLFAYPYGEFNLDIAHWLKDQGYIAFGQQSGAIGPETFKQALPRYPAGGIYANPKTLKTKLFTLSFKIDATQYKEPVLNANNPPELVLNIPVEDFYPSQIQCYSGSEGELQVEKQVEDGVVTVTTQAQDTINSGRDRYNCTAPSIARPGYYYWYSQQWINPDIPNR